MREISVKVKEFTNGVPDLYRVHINNHEFHIAYDFCVCTGMDKDHNRVCSLPGKWKEIATKQNKRDLCIAIVRHYFEYHHKEDEEL